MNEYEPARVALAVNRALWGEVSAHVRAVQYRLRGHAIDLRFVFDQEPGEEEHDSVSCAGAELAADFSDAQVFEDTRVVPGDAPLTFEPDWQVAFVRWEPERPDPAATKARTKGTTPA